MCFDVGTGPMHGEISDQSLKNENSGWWYKSVFKTKPPPDFHPAAQAGRLMGR